MNIKSIISILIIATIALQFNGCSEPCGPVKVINPITELTLAVGDTISIDLKGDPPVFNEIAHWFYFKRLDDSNPYFDANYYGLSTIQIIGKKQGAGVIQVIGECDISGAGSYAEFDIEIVITNKNGD